MKIVALVGNPNAGKTTLFNALTGGQEQVGNWPGTTVERIEGFVKIGNHQIRLVDLPGIYALSAFSLDERLARDFLLKEKIDLAVVVIDSSNLERNLYLLLQIREMGIRTVVALNMWDVMEKNHAELDEERFGKLLGTCAVVKTVGNQNRGIKELKEAIKSCLTQKEKAEILKVDYGPDIEKFIELVVSFGGSRFIALSLLQDEYSFLELFSLDQKQQILSYIESLRSVYGRDLSVFVAERRYGFIKAVLSEVLSCDFGVEKRLIATEYIDRFLTNRIIALPLFALVMYLMFTTVFKIARPFVVAIESFFQFLSGVIELVLQYFHSPDWLVSFIVSGLLDGVGSILVFLPNIFFLYLFISILEDSGYLARVAFIMDKFMHRLGLHGKSFIPMLIGFGCNVPAIMATRTLSNQKDRIITALIIPFMSCSARLPVYVLFASAFFRGKENIVVFALYSLGILIGIISGWLFNKVLFPKSESLLIMEMPPYRWPSLKVVLKFSLLRTFEFVKKAGTVILLAVVFIWILASLPASVEYASKDSWLGRIGQFLAPVFSWAGFGFWQASVALIFGIVAKEVVVGTLGTLLCGGQQEALSTVLPYYFDKFSAIAFLVMTLLYIPCIATISALKKELGWRWASFSTVYTILIGWIVSVLVYNLLRLLF